MKKYGMWLAAALLFATAAGTAQAQRFGGQLAWGSDSDIGVGARAEFDIPNTLSKTGAFSKAFIIVPFDYYFIDCSSGADCTYWELNPALAIPITATTLHPYVGAGLNIAHQSRSFGGSSLSDTETGLNLLAGLKFLLGGAQAFSEARVALGGSEQFELSFGLLFGGGK